MDGPVFQIFSNLMPAALHQTAWETCMATQWSFGNQSNESKSLPFWKMELDGVPAKGPLKIVPSGPINFANIYIRDLAKR